MGDTAKQFSLQNFRPEGFAYPIGLTLISVSNTAANTTGGDQTIDGNFAVHTFTSSGNLTIDENGTDIVDVLIVAGGGGTASLGGGGGAGGLLYAAGHPLLRENTYQVIVGAGGGPGHPGSAGANGTNSSIGISGIPSSNVEAVGGGGGGLNPGNGRAGGSGGGGGGPSSLGAVSLQSPSGGVTGYGNPGGGGYGGGGGALTAGQGATWPQTNIYGGFGITYSISGSDLPYAAGGSGIGATANSANGIGGVGSPAPGGTATSGTINRGSGGGAGWSSPDGASGGSGVVIVRYQTNLSGNNYSIN